MGQTCYTLYKYRDKAVETTGNLTAITFSKLNPMFIGFVKVLFKCWAILIAVL